MFELSDLAVFRAVVEAGGVTKAALRLNRVQSNVTARVKRLEEQLGTPLFSRMGRGLQLAPAGAVLLSYAERLLDLADEARDAVQGGALKGVLRLGCMESTAAVRLPVPLAEFHRRYPDIALDLRTGASRPLVEQVLRGELDCALVGGPVVDSRLDHIPIYRETLVVAAPAGAAPDRAEGLALLAFQNGCAYRQNLEDWLAARGIIPERVVEMNSYHGMLGCVAAGMGLAMVPQSLIDVYPGRDALSLWPLEPEWAQLPTQLVWRRAAPRARIDALAEVLMVSA